MAKRTKLTNNSDETDLSELFSGDNIFYIPYFQRPYKWTRKRVEAFQDDLLNIVDGTTDNHFLGAIIIHGRRANPSEPTVYDVIDGQQRITTVFLHLYAAIRSLCDLGQVDEALALFQKYAAIGRKPKGLSNLKIHPCKEDRNQLNSVLNSLLANVAFKEKLGSYYPIPLPKTGSPSGAVTKNFDQALRFFREQSRAAGLERVRALYEAMLESISVVQIDVWDPTNGPKIFDSLNSRQEPMTVGDLVRNEIFSRIADRTSEDIDNIDEIYWQPFYQKFHTGGKNIFDSYFFPFGLIHNPNLSKSEIYSALSDKWDKLPDPKTIIEDLSQYQDAFIDLVTAQNFSNHPPAIHAAFARLSNSGAPTSTYPFLMRLSRAIADGQCTVEVGLLILGVIEAFLVRRAICGVEPTGLHAVFKRLWGDCEDELSASRVTQEIKKYTTVFWPDDNIVRASVSSRKLYKTSIIVFLIKEYDISLDGDTPKDIPWIEHVLPQTLSESWAADYTKDEHSLYVDTFANLIPLSSKMNTSLQNSAYSKKRSIFEDDSMFKTARQVAKTYSTWTKKDLDDRSLALGDWVCPVGPAAPRRSLKASGQ